MKTATYLANVTDPALTRDSCVSARVADRVLWTCRDTQNFNVTADRPQQFPIITNSAAWTNLAYDGGPELKLGPKGAASNGSNNILEMYSAGETATFPAYFPLQPDQCGEGGACADGTRWVVWQDQPPLFINSSEHGALCGYTWIPNQQLHDGLNAVYDTPSYSLYRSCHPLASDNTTTTTPDALPPTELISPDFYHQGEIGYGRYGALTHAGYAYLYGHATSETNPTKATALARVPVAAIENRTAYEYFQSSTRTWTSFPPTLATAGPHVLPHAGLGGQGTFYYSSHFARFLWIGQSAGLDGAAPVFYIAAALRPEGPWTPASHLFDGRPGDHPVAGGYSLQAHPSLLPSGPGVASEGGIFLSWTQQWREESVGSVYVTPLVWLEFE
jgi:hypothetical protein